MIFDAMVTTSQIGTSGGKWYKLSVLVDRKDYYRLKKAQWDVQHHLDHWLNELQFVEDEFSDNYTIIIGTYFDISPFKDPEDLKKIFTTSGYFLMYHTTPGCEIFINLRKELENI